MLRTYRLFTVLGIPVAVHGTLPFLLVILSLLYPAGEGPRGSVITLLFALQAVVWLFLHELGHGIAARWRGLPVARITLYPFGGVTAVGRGWIEPRSELRLALAGPLVNLVAGALLAPLWTFTQDRYVLFGLVFNLGLGLFNLLPGFPMDGGRVLRALLAHRKPYLEATRIAVRVGQWLAAAAGVAGLLWLEPLLVLLSIYIVLAARAELVMATIGAPLGEVRETIEKLFEGNPGREQDREPEETSGQERSPPPQGDGEIIEMGPDGEVRRIYRRGGKSTTEP